jgi:DNA replication protein DnaC
MEQSIGEVMQQQYSLQEKILTANPWDDIELTQEEQDYALSQAKRFKYDYIERVQKERRKQAYIESLKTPWNAEELKSWIIERSKQLKNEIVIDDTNSELINTLCKYFSQDKAFESLKDGYSLKKGLLIQGDVGVGKTFLMTLFSRNKTQCYNVINCKLVASLYAKDGELAIEAYSNLHYEPADPRYFYVKEIGFCFDDLGTEDDKKNFGNQANVMADIILARYSKKYMFEFDKTHITTNLAKSEIETIYGTRVYDRMLEMFNFIPINGKSWRRK